MVTAITMIAISVLGIIIVAVWNRRHRLLANMPKFVKLSWFSLETLEEARQYEGKVGRRSDEIIDEIYSRYLKMNIYELAFHRPSSGMVSLYESALNKLYNSTRITMWTLLDLLKWETPTVSSTACKWFMDRFSLERDEPFNRLMRLPFTRPIPAVFCSPDDANHLYYRAIERIEWLSTEVLDLFIRTPLPPGRPQRVLEELVKERLKRRSEGELDVMEHLNMTCNPDLPAELLVELGKCSNEELFEAVLNSDLKDDLRYRSGQGLFQNHWLSEVQSTEEVLEKLDQLLTALGEVTDKKLLHSEILGRCQDCYYRLQALQVTMKN